MGYPGILNRAEFATGLLIRSIKINGNYLLVDECNINQSQNIDSDNNYIQGGPSQYISFYDSKKITGSISFPIRVDSNNSLEQAVKELINHAQSPTTALSIDTNHVLVHTPITAENHATDNNKLLKLDQVIVSSLTLRCSQNEAANISVNFEGMIDSNADSNYSIPNENALLGRALTWGDCNAYREESSLRNINSFSIQIDNKIETPTFLLPYQTYESGIASTRNDQINLLGFSSTKWTGNLNELVRVGADLETFIHGGYIKGENLTFEVGPLKVLFQNPLFKISQLPLTSGILTRTVEWIGITKPKQALTPYSLITIN